MSQTCAADVPRHKFSECDPCNERYVTYQDTVHIQVSGGTQVCVITRKYRWRNCYIGLAIGKHAYSITLLPGEELELEVVRSEKFSAALHEQKSIEQEIEIEVQKKILSEWSKVVDIGAKFTHSGEAKYFGFKGKSVMEFERDTKEMEKKVEESIQKSAISVSQKYETSIDLKTEVENKFRSVRKVKNPNSCQPVTYHYFQIMKKFKRELFLVEQTYDCQPPAGLVKEPGLVLYTEEPSEPSRLNPNIVAQPPAWTLRDDVKASLPSCETAPVTDARERDRAVMVPFERPGAKEYTKERAIADLRESVGDKTADEVSRALDPIGGIADPGGGGLITSVEICVGTDGFYVEAQVSECAACEDTDLKMKELEVKKAELELEKLKCEIALCEKDVEGGNDKPDNKARVDPV